MIIKDLLPNSVVAVETRSFSDDGRLFPAEAAAIGKAVGKRRQEFATGRACAHGALSELGVPTTPIASGPHGEPQWPAGVVGSITHTEGYCASAVAWASEVLTVGIDAEPNKPLRRGVLEVIGQPEELSRLRAQIPQASGVHLDRLLFSVKEAVFKAWFPMARQRLRFEDASVAFKVKDRTFSARLLVEGPIIEGQQLASFFGRWLARDGLLITAIALSRRGQK